MMNVSASMNGSSYCGGCASTASSCARINIRLLDTARDLVVSICVLDVRLYG